jgi:hypothetical protein
MHAYLRDDAGVLYPVMIDVRPSPLAEARRAFTSWLQADRWAGIQHA